MYRDVNTRRRTVGVEDLSSWRSRVLSNVGSAGAPGVLLVVVSTGVTLAGCLVIGVLMYNNQIVLPVRGRLVAFILALPAIGLGLLTFYVLAPFFYAWHCRRNAAVGRPKPQAQYRL